MSETKSPFHRGEKEIQSRLGIEDKMAELGRRMIRDYMPDEHQEFFSRLPLLVVGTIDPVGRPWASVLAGEPGFVRAADSRALNVTARPIYGDPLSEALVDGADIGALVSETAPNTSRPASPRRRPRSRAWGRKRRSTGETP
jgi:predicted pyridoxine 5'-phosphate oxidase superfamily flavin-nucleotide-binding protein